MLWAELWTRSLLFIPVPAHVVWEMEWNPIVYLGPYCQAPTKTRNLLNHIKNSSHSTELLLRKALMMVCYPDDIHFCHLRNNYASFRWELRVASSLMGLDHGVTFAVWGQVALPGGKGQRVTEAHRPRGWSQLSTRYCSTVNSVIKNHSASQPDLVWDTCSNLHWLVSSGMNA